MSTRKIELSVGAVKYVDPNDIFTEEEIDAINNKIPELDERVGVVEDEIEEINSSLDSKANKNEIFSMANMGQDIKEAMTGGSVAVVGRNAILTENIADEQVTPEKLSIFEKAKENLWVIDGTTYKGMSVDYSYEDFFTKFKGEFIETSRMLIKTVYLSVGTWSIKCFELAGYKPTIYVYKMDDYLKSNWSAYVGLLARANFSSNIAIESEGHYCIVVYGENGQPYDSKAKFVLTKKDCDDVDEFIPNAYKLKEYINVSIKSEDIPIRSITPEKTDFMEKTTGNLWEFDNIVNNKFSILYNFENGATQFLGSVSETSRFLIKQITLEQGLWSFKAFDYIGLKPTVYIYKKTDYDKQNWFNFVGTFAMANYGCNFDIVDSGEYCIVAYVATGNDFNFNGKIVLSKNNHENVTSYIPIKYRFKGYIETSGNGEKDTLFEGLKNKKLSILGVSIDTYTNHITTGNASYYSPINLASVEMTWWKKLLNKTGMVLDTNNSWSGACATTTKNLASSGVQRCTNLGNNPDFIIISAFALNDWANSDLTSYDKDTMSIPGKDIDLTIQSNYDTYKTTIESYGGAMATIFYRIMEKYHHTKIFVCDAYNYYRNGVVPFTPNIETPKINICNDILYDVARQFGIEVIRVSECGINAFNALEYTVDGKTTGTIGLHPDDAGHTLYFNKVLEAFNKYI